MGKAFQFYGKLYTIHRFSIIIVLEVFGVDDVFGQREMPKVEQ